MQATFTALIHISHGAVFDGARGNYIEEMNLTHWCLCSTKLAGAQAVLLQSAGIECRLTSMVWSAAGKRSLAENFVLNSKGKYR